MLKNLTTKEEVERRLEKLLQKLAMPKAVTVADIKDIIWNAQKNSGSMSLFSMLAPFAKDQETIQEIMQSANEAWNYFPHRILGGKSPADLVKEYQETGKIDQSKQKPLPEQGKVFSDVFEDRYPKKVIFEKIDKETWAWGFPKLYHDLTDELWELEERRVSRESQEKELYLMIKQMPELFDAVNDLARIYRVKREFGLARSLYEQTIGRARKYIPDTFVPGRDRAIWSFLENRPFLRMLAGNALLIEQLEGHAKAIPLYEEILSFNPNDNQGIRGLLATAYLNTNQPEKVIELTSHYPESSMCDTFMGTLLAMYMLKNNAGAIKNLEQIKKYRPHIIKEILKESHPKPATFKEDMIAIGSPDEAYYYWIHQGRLWEIIPGAMDFLRENTKDIQDQLVILIEEDVMKVDFFHDFLLFLNSLKEDPVKLTATGNLSIKSLEPLLKKLKTLKPIFKRNEEYGWKLRTEDEVRSLHLIRIMTDLMHLAYKKHDKLLISKNGKAFLTNLNRVDQFKQLFDYYKNRFNWAYYSYFKNDELLTKALQRQQERIWKLLKSNGAEWVDFKTFCKTLNEDLQLQQYLNDPYSTPEEVLYSRIKSDLFYDPLALFGCVELETKEIDKWSEEIIRFRLTKIGLAAL